jgi:hypothetical protein
MQLMEQSMSLKNLKKLVHTFPGEMGVYAKNLATNQVVAINADTPFYLASVAKVLIMIGAVDSLKSPDGLNDQHEIELYDYREENKTFRYHHIGTNQTFRNLLRRMISSSDTTATDMVVRIVGRDNINTTIKQLAIKGLGEVTSIGELDRFVQAVRNDAWAAVPTYAFEPFIRDNNDEFLIPFHLNAIPSSNDSTKEAYEIYYRTGFNSATPRAMGLLTERLAEETMLNQPWKNDILRDQIFDAGGEGAIGNAVPAARQVDTKGGAKYRVRCELGIVYSGSTPEAVIGVFTQKHDIPRKHVSPLIRHAANLAYRAIGFTHTMPNATPANPGLVFVAPSAGQLFEPGVRPPIKWQSQGLTGRLTLQLVRTSNAGIEQVVQTITTNAIDDGEWHSWTVPANISPASNYHFKLTSNENKNIQTYSHYFALRGAIRVLEPHLGENHATGSNLPIRWTTLGITGRLTIDLFRGNRKVKTISTDAIDDGEWHSLVVDGSLSPGYNYRIRIGSKTDSAVFGWSPRFTIGGKIVVNRPTLNQIVALGSTPIIRWRTDQVNSNLRLKLFRGEETHVVTIADDAIDDGEWHSWTIPTTINDAEGYRIDVSSRTHPAIRGSSHYFQLGARFEWLVPSIQQVPFNGNDHARPHFFPYGNTPTLRWRTLGFLSGNVRLDLLHAGQVVQVIHANAINDGEWHSWTITTTLPASSLYQFRLRSLTRNQVLALSNYFHLGAMVDITLPRKQSNFKPTTRLERGKTPILRWRTTSVPGRLRLELFKRGTMKLVISDDAINDGEWHSWTVPNSLDVSRGYRFKLSSKTNPNVFGFSPWFRVE